jgi:hypothetical protein
MRLTSCMVARQCGHAGGIGLVSVERVESKRVDDFASMSDEELRRFVYSTISRL